MIRKFKKKPVEIEAVQWPDGKDATSGIYAGIIYWIDIHGGTCKQDGDCLIIRTLEGDLRASPRDWIIKGIQNEFYPCKPDIFEQTYMEV